jgi:monoamine oxidase
VLDYCKRLNVALEPFIQLNRNALLHASSAFDGRPQRISDIKADFQGQVSELLAKATEQGRLAYHRKTDAGLRGASGQLSVLLSRQ